MTDISIVEARSKLAEVLNRVAYGGERVLLTRRGLPVVAVVPVADALALEQRTASADAEARLARVQALRGRYSAFAGASAEFASQKADEIALEERR